MDRISDKFVKVNPSNKQAGGPWDGLLSEEGLANLREVIDRIGSRVTNVSNLTSLLIRVDNESELGLSDGEIVIRLIGAPSEDISLSSGGSTEFSLDETGIYEYTIENLSSGNYSYSFYGNENRITSINNISVNFNGISAPTLSGNYSSGSNLANIQWSHSVQNLIDSFILQRSIDNENFETIAQPSNSSSSYQDSNINPNTTYYYRLFARKNGTDSAFSNVVTVVVPEEVATDTYLGILTTQSMVDEWVDRMTNGPFRVAGDAGLSNNPNTPAEWTRINTEAEELLTLPAGAEIWDGLSDESTTWFIARRLRSGAFKYLLTGTTSYANAARAKILEQIAVQNTNLLWRYNQGQIGYAKDDGSIPYWRQPYLFMRIALAYCWIKDTCSPQEQEDIESYLTDNALFYVRSVHSQLVNLFPNRLNNDYNVTGSVASSGSLSSKILYLGDNNSGNKQIPSLAFWYNNRRALMVWFGAMWGIHIGNEELMLHGKLFFKEYLKYSVFSNGAYGELERTTDSSPNQGFLYEHYILEFLSNLAFQFAIKGDFELFEYVTSDGLHGTGGGNKSLKLLLDTKAKLMRGDLLWYHRQSISSDNRIWHKNTKSGTSNNGRHWVSEIWGMSIANIFYKDQYLKDTYLRDGAFNDPYPTTLIGTAGGMGLPWNGSGAVYPSVLFMFGNMEHLNPFGGGETQTPLQIVAAVVYDTAHDVIEVEFNKSLDTNFIPSTSSFQNIEGSISGAKTVTSVEVSGRFIYLTLDEEFDSSDVASFDYVKDTLAPIVDSEGLELDSISGVSISIEVNQSLATNGDFTSNNGVIPTGYNHTPNIDLTSTVVDGTSDGFTGLKWRVEADEAGLLWISFGDQDLLEGNAGKTFRFSFEYRSNVNIRSRGAGSTGLTPTVLTHTANTGNAIEVNAEFLVNWSTSGFDFQLEIQSAQIGDWFEVGNIRVFEI